MWAEQFDLTRNYIDNYKTFYRRQYDTYNFAPSNLLPVLGDNLGWELINPFSSSLSDYFNAISGSTFTAEKIKHNTWKKTLNNLIYIYKSKGTLNSIRALLNIYGYPADNLSVNETRISTGQTDQWLLDGTSPTRAGANTRVGNIAYTQRPIKFTYMNMGEHGAGESLRLDWYKGRATGSSLEFMFKADRNTIHRQILLKSVSGSVPYSHQAKWDLCLLSSSVDNQIDNIISLIEERALWQRFGL